MTLMLSDGSSLTQLVNGNRLTGFFGWVNLPVVSFTISTDDIGFTFGRMVEGPEGMVPVPEPSTIVAGLLLLLPFGASTLRALRKRNQA